MGSGVKIYGAGGHSLVVMEILEQTAVPIVGVYDDGTNHHPDHHDVQPGIRSSTFDRGEAPFIIAVGRNAARAELARLLGGTFGVAIHPTAIVSATARIGEGTVVMAGAIVQRNAQIGKHVIINTGAVVDHDTVIGDFAHISPNATVCGHAEVGEGTFVGAGASIISNVKVGRWVTLQAGTVALTDIADASP